MFFQERKYSHFKPIQKSDLAFMSSDIISAKGRMKVQNMQINKNKKT